MKVLIVAILMLVSMRSFALDGSDVTRWREDIDVFASELTSRHIDPYHTISKPQFDNEVKRLKSALAELTENQVLVELMRLTHSINDGHTSFPLWGKALRRLPVRFKAIGGEFYAISTTDAHRKVLGLRLVSIGKMPIAEVVQQLSQITPFSENAFSTAQRVAQYLNKYEVLNGLGVVRGPEQIVLGFDHNDRTVEMRMNALTAPDHTQQISLNNPPQFATAERISDDLWFGASGSKNTVFVKFRRYTSVRKMGSLADDLLSFINEHESKNLIIDLRDNYGGDFFVGLILAQRLVLADSINWKSGVYVLIDNVTFSAAMSNAVQFSQILNARLVGEPTGGDPSGYQDMGQFSLPNSGLDVTYSKRLYRFKDTDADALHPDRLVEMTIEDYRKGNDAQLEAVLDEISSRSRL